MVVVKQRGRPVQLPWHNWLNGSPQLLFKGRDYTCSTRSMMVMVRQRMRLMNYSASVYVEGNTILINPR